MTNQEILNKLNVLPKGGITCKKIKGKNGKEYEYHFLQWTENGKQISKSIKSNEVDIINVQLEERKRLENLLKFPHKMINETIIEFNTQIRLGNELKSFVESVKGYKKRDGFKDLFNYVYGDEYNKVFILYGLRRTGKTTLIKQLILDMNINDFNKTAFIQISKNDNLAKLNKDLMKLEKQRYKYIFIDEVTFLDDFIEGAALLSDIYAASGMKIILSGTDSLGFWITKSNELYDRCKLLHTTFISYKEFSSVLGISGIDNYIEYGGTMSISGVKYNYFSKKAQIDEYINTVIANNIQHSLKEYQYGGHFRHLYSLYEQNELTSAINRVVEDMNHRFTIEVIERDFKSNDLALSANNLRKDSINPTTILDDIDKYSFTERLRELLEIKNKNERTIRIDDEHIVEIKEYLIALDMIEKIEIKDINSSNKCGVRYVFTQPELRYAQAKSFIDSLLLDDVFNNISASEKKYIISRILSDIKGRMMEDIVLLETKLANPNKNVFKLQFSDGEFDMVINDPETLETQIYEIKYSQERVSEQTRHLLDKDKCDLTEFRYGTISKKAVIYRGKTCVNNEIDYINVEEYLSTLH